MVSMVSRLFNDLCVREYDNIMINRVLQFARISPMFRRLIINNVVHEGLLSILAPLPRNRNVLGRQMVGGLNSEHVRTVLLLTTVLLRRQRRHDLTLRRRRLRIRRLLSILLNEGLLLRRLLISTVLRTLIR